jgi:hypothetical protein
LTRIFYWRIEEDDLVLYPDFMDDGLKGHTPFQELRDVSDQKSALTERRAYFFSALLLPTPLTRNGVASELTVIRGAVELSAPHLNDVLQSLKEDSFDLLVQLGNPVVKICVAFKIESIDLGTNVSAGNRRRCHPTYSSLDSAQELRE